MPNWKDEIIKQILGYEGATALHNKLTAARAGYLANINNAQLLNVPNLSTLTVARIGYLDELAAANLPADIDSLKNSRTRIVCYKDQWSQLPITSLAFSNAAGDKTFSNVTFPTSFLPSGAVTQGIYLMIKWRKQVDSSSAPNAINAASKTIRVKKSTGAWGTDDLVGITTANGQWHTAADATEGGDMVIGDADIKSEVDDIDNATYNVRSEQTNRLDSITVTAASLTLYDIYSGLRVFFTLGT